MAKGGKPSLWTIYFPHATKFSPPRPPSVGGALRLPNSLWGETFRGGAAPGEAVSFLRSCGQPAQGGRLPEG